ncbi:hypothetical protein Coch_0881 [Capnocytophaga ochracea DSM 7271]|uniref:DUF6291 domain-containing protein n=1 Tax=Capnocytophaga ochracea (strain ATCC 27872 / DSM 7271 / CCUG 9716 / JCM 12966 / NCTC 12371 / SS31 / VPI 2845) TaxID=521097 RepID=C7M990_CAPOD|nr:DUF6291 domain-containing protein [Capnocytophaga ochracea]ACU92436.1 hypothetical protein Coch_0881 [Capnocytophaga ochracea DSM 7271]UAK51175.1 DUF6291 domain-containing protein [Capnocytophaga ochracea]
MERDTFVFYKDWLNVIRDLPSEVQLEVYQAIAEYAIYGNLIELKPLAKVAFGFVKQTIDRDTQKYISIKEKRKEAGVKGGRPLKNKDLEESKEKQKNQLVFEKSKKSKSPLNVNVNVNDNVNDISFLEKKKQKSVCVNFGEKEKKEEALNAEKETSPQVAPAPPPFNFKKAMLAEGFASELVDEWLKIRKAKKAINSEIAFKTFIEQVKKTGQDKNAILERVVQKQWRGFEASWLQADQIPQQTNNNQIILDENGKIITNEQQQQSTSDKQRFYAGRQTADNIRNNMQGWGAHTFGNS